MAFDYVDACAFLELFSPVSLVCCVHPWCVCVLPQNITVFVMCLDERARVARVVRVWERALLTLKIALQLMGGV